MGRSPCCEEKGLKKGPWTPEEDRKLVDYIQKHGHGSWRALPRHAGLKRCGKSCRLRWTNYLRPDIKRGKFSDEEEQIILELHSLLGNKWSRIAAHLPGRTDNEIKNFWNTHLRKKLIQRGIDPKTHKPISDVNFLSDLSNLLSFTNLPNLTSPWDNALRALQMDVTQLAKIQLLQSILQVINTCPPLPNMEEANPFGSLNPIPTQLSPNELSMIHTPPNVANSWECLEGGLFNSEALALDAGDTLKGTYDTQTSSTENSLPAPSSSNQMQSNMNPNYHHSYSPTSTSSVFGDWDKLVSAEEANFSWQDLME